VKITSNDRVPSTGSQEESGNDYFDTSYLLIHPSSISHSRILEDGVEANEENEQNQDGDNEENEEKDREPGGNDDFFDDFIQDDLVSSTYNNYNNNGNNNGQQQQTYDDFYNFEKNKTPTLLPLETSTIVSFVVAALALGLGASSGTGGGGTIVPIYILIARLPIQVAIPIGAITVLGGAVASTCFNWTRRHPLADRVLIDWDLVLVMEPLVLVGALLGTLFHRLLSEKFLIVVLVLLLSITAHTTLSKAMRMYQAEIRYIRHLRAAQSEPPIGASPSLISKTDTWGAASESERIASGEKVISPRGGGYGGAAESSSQLDSVEKQAILILNPDFVTLRSELIQQEKFTPRGKIIALCCMFSVFIFLNIMVGGGAYKSPWDIICGSVAFWVVHVIMIAFLIASAWAAHSYVVARFEIKKLVRFDYVHGDIKWDTKSALLYPAVFVSAGLFAGTLGIGGGSTYRLHLTFNFYSYFTF
jgi:Sulfite exporter TauE/SafE